MEKKRREKKGKKKIASRNETATSFRRPWKSEEEKRRRKSFLNHRKNGWKSSLENLALLGRQSSGARRGELFGMISLSRTNENGEDAKRSKEKRKSEELLLPLEAKNKRR